MAFVPIVAISLILVSLIRTKSTKKSVSPKRTENQEQADEIDTVILPVINSK
jgi:hypothetical protein